MTNYVPLAIYLAGFVAWVAWSQATLWLRWGTLSKLARKHDLPEDRSTLAVAFAFLGAIWPAAPFIIGYVAWYDRKHPGTRVGERGDRE